MRRRFAIISLSAFCIQAVVAFFLLYHSGYRLVVLAYYPFVFLLAQAVPDGSDEKLGYVLLGAPVLGALVYSVLLALAVVCIPRLLHVAPDRNM
jgi:hypothetical protein